MVGFVGLGIMGKPMAKNLIKSGCEMIVFDRNPQAMGDLAAMGAQIGSLQKVGAGCDVVMTMLPDGPDVEEVILGKGGAAESMRSGSVLIDMSSISPIVSRKIASVLSEKGISMLDAPVSGGEQGAVDGTLSFMVGGSEKDFQKYQQLLAYMGKSVVLCGPVGAGNTVKLANQIIVALNIAAVSEAITLASQAGVNPSVVFDAIKGGLAGSNAMNSKLPKILARDFAPGFKIDLHIKDLVNAMSTAHAVGAPVPLASAAMEILQRLHADGFGQEDHSAIMRYYEKLTDRVISN